MERLKEINCKAAAIVDRNSTWGHVAWVKACNEGFRPTAEEAAYYVKVIEVPPGPPVLAPIVAEVYGPEAEGRRAVAQAVRREFDATPGVVDVDDSSIAVAPRTLLVVDRRKAALLGVPQQAIATTLRTGLAGEAATWLHDQGRYPSAAVIRLPPTLHGDLDALLQLRVRSAAGRLVPIRELVTISSSVREQPEIGRAHV